MFFLPSNPCRITTKIAPWTALGGAGQASQWRLWTRLSFFGWPSCPWNPTRKICPLMSMTSRRQAQGWFLGRQGWLSVSGPVGIIYPCFQGIYYRVSTRRFPNIIIFYSFVLNPMMVIICLGNFLFFVGNQEFLFKICNNWYIGNFLYTQSIKNR